MLGGSILWWWWWWWMDEYELKKWKKMKKESTSQVIIILYGLAAVALLFIFLHPGWFKSYLVAATIVQAIQKSFQDVGFYNRPLSTSIYLLIIAYFLVFTSAYLRREDRSLVPAVWMVVGTFSGILLFLTLRHFLRYFIIFFTAKTVLLLVQNPYYGKPLIPGVDSMFLLCAGLICPVPIHCLDFLTLLGYF